MTLPSGNLLESAMLYFLVELNVARNGAEPVWRELVDDSGETRTWTRRDQEEPHEIVYAFNLIVRLRVTEISELEVSGNTIQ